MSPIKVFWVEESGNWVLTIYDVDRKLVKREVLPKVEADRKWAARDDEIPEGGHRGMSPMFRLPDGSEVESNDLPPGALRDQEWNHQFPEWCGPDGLSLAVRLPNGNDWNIDGRCSNCTRKDDTKHKCWVRHGNPKSGDLHVDKEGDTCSAGAGSIMSGNFHGFLHHGFIKAA